MLLFFGLLNELGEKDKMQGFPSILSLFRNKFNRFYKTGAGMLDSICHIYESHPINRENFLIMR